MTEEKAVGTLFLVATPIGNLGDITLRAIETLKKADLIAAEDTRQTKKLLAHYNIHKPLTSYYEHNKKTKGPLLINKLLSGESIALVSDAGMPGISDPGSDLVGDCIDRGIKVTVIPGPSALLVGLAASGLRTDSFLYLGFLPGEKKKRRQVLESIAGMDRTLVLYISPHRLENTLAEILGVLGDRRCCLARELTKFFEHYHRGTLREMIALSKEGLLKGEMTLIIEGRPPETKSSPGWEQLQTEYGSLLGEGLDKKTALKKLAARYAISKRELYNRFHREREQRNTDAP